MAALGFFLSAAEDFRPVLLAPLTTALGSAAEFIVDLTAVSGPMVFVAVESAFFGPTFLGRTLGFAFLWATLLATGVVAGFATCGLSLGPMGLAIAGADAPAFAGEIT